MNEMNSARLWAGISALILLVSVFAVGMVLSMDAAEDETYFLVYKRGITADELTEVNGLTVLAEYDEFVLVSSGARDMNELMYQGYTIEALYNREDVYLHSHSFNVGEGLPEIPAELRVDSYPAGVRRPYIVQFIGPIMADWQNELVSMGVMPQQYRHRYNYIVEMDRDTAKAVSSLEFVNWVGIYQPAYKFDNALLDASGVLDLEIYAFTSVDTLALAQYISGMDAEVRLIRDGHLFVETDASNLVAIANMPHVITITPRVTDLHFMNADATWVAQTGESANRKVTDMGVIGLGELITVMDSELYPYHEAFADPDGNPIGDTHRKVQAHYIPEGAGGDLDSGVYHGTHVSGSVLGQSPPYDSYSNHDGNAMGARLVFQDVSPGMAVTPPTDMYTHGFGDPYSWGSRVHTNSWGGGSGYSDLAVTSDEFIWDHKDFNILFAAGNDGSRGAGSISNQAEGKNIFTVGAVNNAPNHNNLAGFSSRGYASDGRIKPTMLHVGAQLNSAARSADGYSSMQGTSMSTPGLAGQVGQVRHYYTGGWYPSGVANPADGFNPSGALVKATMINGAVEITGTNAYENDQRFPNNDQGFGLSRLDRALYFEGDARKLFVFDSWNEDVELNTGESWEMEFSVEDATQELEVTLVWSDYPGAAGADPTIVNDLDLELFTPGGTRYVGNAFTGYNPGYSEPNPTSNPWNGPRTGAWDGLNVEENILLLPTENGVEEGVYQLTVSAHQVAQGPQPFAVVISGGIGLDITPSPSIELTRPTGGEVWNAGATEDITWTTTEGNGTITNVDLEFSLDGGSSWDYIVEGTVDTGSYHWTLPDVSTLNAMVRATVHDDEEMSGRDTSDLFAILGDPPAPPSNLKVELIGLAEILENNIFDVDFEPWNLTRMVDQGEARWDAESYMEGGSIYVSAEAEGEGNILTELSYWEQSIQPTTEEIVVSGTYRKLITVGSGFGWATYVDNATVEILVHDTDGGWQTVLIDEEITAGDSGWTDFESVAYIPTGSVDNVRVLLHVTAEGDTGPAGGDRSATGELWMDGVSVSQADEEATENNLLTWDASPDDPGDITHYEIRRADNQDGVRWGELLATVDADGSPSYSYTDYGAGTADDIIWWYTVNAVNEYGQSDGNEVSIPEPSAPSPSIELTRPTGGETWDANTTEAITWNTTEGDHNITVVDLEFSLDGGSSWDYIVEGTGDTGTYSWEIPDDIFSTTVRVRGTVHDDEGLSGSDTSGLFTIMGDPPESPSNLNVELVGLGEILDNNVFDGNYEQWNLTRLVAEGEARWDNESYMEGGSIYVSTEAEGEGTITTEMSYWEQSIEPTSDEIVISGTYRKVITIGSGMGWSTSVHNATVEILVHDTATGWESLLIDDDISGGDSGWNEFDQVVYVPSGNVDNVRVLLHVTAEGDTGPFGGNHTAIGELWIDRVSVSQADETGTENNLLTWDASPDDPDTVTHYEIFRADNEDGNIRWGMPLATVDADGSASYSYTDYGAGTADEIIWWYVVNAVNEHGQSDGNEDAVPEPDAPNPSIELTRPTGGEIWDAGTSESITWNTTEGDHNITVVDLEFSVDEGSSWDYIVEGTGDTGTYSWDIPGDIYSTAVLVRATVHDDEGLTGRDTSGLFTILGDLPASPSNLSVEHSGSTELIENGIFDGDYEPWSLTRVEDEGHAGWSNESYLEGGSIHVMSQAQGEGNVSTEDSYWEQSFDPTTNEIVISGAFRKNLTVGSGAVWATHIHNATVEILVHDTILGWQSVLMDNDTTPGNFEWVEFDPIVYVPVGYVHAIRARMHVTAEGDTGPLGGDREAIGELWMDHISVIEMDDTDATEDNLLTWDASHDDPELVSHYLIFRADNEDGVRWGEHLATVDADGSASYSYTDYGAGTADSILWWYVVQAVDHYNRSDGNEDAVREPIEEDTPYFFVTITSYDGEVYEGETVTIEYNVTNTGNLEGTQDIVFSVDDTQEDVHLDITLDVGDSHEGTFTWSTEVQGMYVLMVSSDDNLDLVMVNVVEEIYTLTVGSTHGGEVTSPGEGSFEYGVDTVVDLVATAYDHYYFVEWIGDIDNIADPLSAETNITIEGDYSITAVFDTDLQEYDLTMIVEGEGTTDPVPGTHTYLEGTNVTITAIPDSGWEFVEWTGDATGTDLEVTITMDDNKTVTAVFEETEVPTYTLTVDVEGEGTVDIDPDLPEYDEGTSVTLTANPASGWQFVEWTGDATGTELSVTITMDENKTVTAVFEEIPEHNYTLTVNVEGEGTVDIDPDLPEYEHGTSVILTAIPASGWEFVEWTGDATGTDLEVTIIMDGNKTVTAVFAETPPPTYTLTVNVEGEGSVDVDPDLPEYEHGTSVTLTAIPADGWEFIEWTGDATGTGLSVTVTMDDDMTVTAVFEELPPPTYTLTIVVEGQGTTDPAAGTHDYDEGTTVTITATPAAGWEFIRWEGDATGTSPSTSVTMDDDLTVTAVFEELPPPTYTLTIIVDGEGTTDPAEGTHDYDEGTTVTITATPASGWEFIRWEGDATGTSPSTTVTMDDDLTVTAVFEEIPPPTYTLTIVVEGEGTTDPAAGTHTYDEGTDVTITATPDDGWEFVEWTGDATGTDLSVTITMDDDVTVTAVFAEIPTPTYTLTVNIEGQGTTDPAEGTHTYDEGTDVTITATPADGWEFVEWTGDATGTDLEITVTMDDDKTVNAVFVQETIPTPTYTLTVNTDGEGVVTVSPEGTEFEEGTTVTLTAIPTEGWTFVRWDDGASGTSASTSVTMDEDKTVTAVFERETEPSEPGFLEDYWWLLLLLIIVIIVIIVVATRRSKDEPVEDESMDEEFEDFEDEEDLDSFSEDEDLFTEDEEFE